jgi:hypothetical protein
VSRWTQLELPAELLPQVRGAAPAAGIHARAEIIRLKAEGLGPAAIAARLNAGQVPTPSGRGQWWPDSVRRHVDPGPWADYIRRYRQRQR